MRPAIFGQPLAINGLAGGWHGARPLGAATGSRGAGGCGAIDRDREAWLADEPDQARQAEHPDGGQAQAR